MTHTQPTPETHESHSFARERCTRAGARPRGHSLPAVCGGFAAYSSTIEPVSWVIGAAIGLIVSSVLLQWGSALLRGLAVLAFVLAGLVLGGASL